VFHEEVKPSHSNEHEQGIGTSVLGKADVIGHEGQCEDAREGDRRRERSCKEIDHRDGEGTKDQGDNTEVPFWFSERVKLMCKNEKQRRLKICRVFFIKI